MSSKVYRIKPLEWTPFLDKVSARTETIVGRYLVCCDEWWPPLECHRNCDSLEHGKQLAEQHYRERMEAGLEEVTASGSPVRVENRDG